MRILLLTHSFNSLTQRFFVELNRAGHEVSVEFDINDQVTREAVALWRPELIVAPFLKRAIPEDIWRAHLCLIVHPGPPGDRGPSALDRAVLDDEDEWGVTLLQAERKMDAGPVWASSAFPMRRARKSSLYRNEVTEAAVRALWQALERIAAADFRPWRAEPGGAGVRGRERPLLRQADRRIDWSRDSSDTVVRKVRSGDGQPGVVDELCGAPRYLYNAWAEDDRPAGAAAGGPGTVIATRDGAVCRATVDGAVWLTHLRDRPEEGRPTFKLPAAQVLAGLLEGVPELALPIDTPAAGRTWREILYREQDAVGYLHFDFYNGAMSTEQCERLLAAFRFARGRDTRVIVLMGGSDFWSNGLDLNRIEAADSPADESWRNINAMNDLAREIITTDRQITVSALQGNAGAGGVFLALAADRVLARNGVILNPHYKSMGNLFGSEYWTYLLPPRVGEERAAQLTQRRLPLGAPEALAMGLIDAHFGDGPAVFAAAVACEAERLAASADFGRRLADKSRSRAEDEARKPLEAYRREELERMRLNFYGFDPSYHVARYHFVCKVPHSRTPLYLARHRGNVSGMPLADQRS